MFCTRVHHLILGIFCALSLCYTTGIAGTVSVVTITEDFASIAESIGYPHVKVKSLVKGSRNLHSVNPKPSMVMAVRSADLLIRLGMQQDTWIDGLIQVARNNRIFPGQPGYMDASHGIQKLEVPKKKVDGRMGDTHIHGNPHYWLDPENGKLIAGKVRDHLTRIDPKHQDVYEKNYQSFVKKIDDHLPKWKQKMASVSTYQIVTYHKVWSYLFKAFGLKSAGELELVPGVPPTTKHLWALKSKLQSQKKPVLVISANYYPEHVGKSFANEMNGTHVSIPANVGENGIESYIGLFEFLSQEMSK